jgi:hypothetical protein
MMSSAHPDMGTLRWSAIVIALSVGFSAMAEPPITLDCTIRYWNEAFKKEKEHDYYTGYSTMKVAPKDIAWLRPGENPVGRPYTPSRTIGFIELGSCRKGNLTESTDLRNLLMKLSKLASDHGANAICYEKSSTEIRFQFLRIQDAILNAGRRASQNRGQLRSERVAP